MKRKTLIPLIVAAVIAVIAVAVFLSHASFDNTVSFTVRDAVSKQWVWNATISMQDRLIKSYYQSDRGPITYTFTHLEKGESELSVSAPSYEDVTIPVEVGRGENTLEEPIELQGYEIPDLDHFIIFEEQAGNDIVLELHPVGTDGHAVVNHPCVNLWIGCMVSEQVKDGAYIQEPMKTGSERGKTLFQGKLDWEFDASPETVFRYTARIPGKAIQQSKAPYLAIDYIIIVPDSRKISYDEVDQLMSEAVQASKPQQILQKLEGEEDRFDYYFITNWNVKRP
jgi:hypothetical protein